MMFVNVVLQCFYFVDGLVLLMFFNFFDHFVHLFMFSCLDLFFVSGFKRGLSDFDILSL